MKQKGREQIRKHKSNNPKIKETIEQQLSNVQDSYDSLLKTANQIKARLENSLLKFQEYEDILSSIWSNLEELETSINIEIDEPKELGKAKILLESMRVRGLAMFTFKFLAGTNQFGKIPIIVTVLSCCIINCKRRK